jgi:RNA polymerase sigma factor (sigma-70 family)
MAQVARAASAAKAAGIRGLYERHGDRLFRAALRLGGGRRSFAEDVVHDAFAKLCESWDRLQQSDDPDDLAGWLYRVTMNCALSKLRRESFRGSALVRALLGAAAIEPPSADVLARLHDGHKEALDALGGLPPKERVAFVMVHLDDASLADVAHTLACSTSYACKLAQRAAVRLTASGWRAPPRVDAVAPAVRSTFDLDAEVSVG